MHVRPFDGAGARSTRERLSRQTRRHADEFGISPGRNAHIRRIGVTNRRGIAREEVTLTISNDRHS